MGNLFRHGSEMYKQTINLKNEPLTAGDDDQGVILEKLYYQRTVPKPKVQNNSVSFIKTTQKETPAPQPESKYRRVAKFLILIGSEQASEILAELDPEQVDQISKEIALIKFIKPEERGEIFAEFHSLFSKPYHFAGSSRGGVETARRLLYAAKGPGKGEELLNKAVPESRENLFGFLEEFSAEQIVTLLKTESPQTTALIMSRLPAKLSAGALVKLPPENKAEILKRMAKQREVAPYVLEQITAALKEKARHFAGKSDEITIDGMGALTAILKQSDYAFGDRIISELRAENPGIGNDLKEKLYTLDDVINSTDKPIQDKLSLMSEQEIAILLKGRDLEFREKILSCVSAGRRKLIREEFEILGAVPKCDCDAAAGDFLSWFRQARERGEIILNSDEDVFI
ncbi:MAG: flagellar motor switch protein FliG [Treponema sp.]|nr:flagellar motor switch protein FliG [Treponema sp.]